MLTAGIPIFSVRDLSSTLAHYREVLGFEVQWTYGEPATFGSVRLGSVEIFFSQLPEGTAGSAGGSIWLKAEDVDALYAMHRERGAVVPKAPENMPWGAREYTVVDPNGVTLRFAGAPKTEPERSELGPAAIRIERRVPSLAEHLAVHGGGKAEAVAETLAATWRGWVAVDEGSGEPVGVTRAMLDGPGWVSIWDVHVREDQRGRGIGTALMKAALADLAVECPGANVYLFTFKDGFYERMGFSKQGTLMRQV